MSIIKINKLEGHSLPDNLKQSVVEECRRLARPAPVRVIICIVFSLAFIYGGVSILSLGESPEEQKIYALCALPFLLVPFFLVYAMFIRPVKVLKMAERDDYEYYIGVLTNKYYTRSNNGHHHYLRIDDVIKVSCTTEDYRNAVVGNSYIVLYFRKRKPEVCFRIANTQKEIY